MSVPSLAFFTRLLDAAAPGLLDEAPAAERYRLATDQIRHAERFGIGRAWVAQHHFRAAEGGLPAPFVFLAHVAAATSEIRLGTGVVTLPLEDPIRVAEDAVVADLLSGGRIDLGLGSGGTPSSFVPFGQDVAAKAVVYDEKLDVLLDALAGREIGGGNTLYPDPSEVVATAASRASLGERVWQATFSPAGGTRAGRHGHGLLLSRTQPRSAEAPDATLAELQHPIIDAYVDALPAGVAPRVTASRTVFVADDRSDALRFAERGLHRAAEGLRRSGHRLPDDTLDELIAATDTHLGTPEEVVASLATDSTLARATEVAFQVHSVDAPHDFVLRSIELFATEVAPALGWGARDRSFEPLGRLGKETP
jgi:putative FMN-dependent luciferase-like monooxygenase